MNNLATLLGLKPPTPYAVKKLLALPNNAPDPTLIYGLELEIEHITENHGAVTAIRETTDNSLRNSGREYITVPMCFRELEYVLNNFFTRNKFTEHNYSERCSVHVHTNCTDLTPEQLSTLLLIYQVYEQSLFNFVGGDRDKNIFCVPWSETTLTFGIVDRLMEQGVEALRRWQKYTALNLLPLFTQGSIEFRHMPGTHDVAKILQWCALIGCMFSYARKTPLEEVKTALVQLNTTSEYKPLTEAVFGEHAAVLLDGEQAVLAIENGIVNMKYSLMKDTVPAQVDVRGAVYVQANNARMWFDEAVVGVGAVTAGNPVNNIARPLDLRLDPYRRMMELADHGRAMRVYMGEQPAQIIPNDVEEY